MTARDDTDMDEELALAILSAKVDQNNNKIEEKLESIYGDLEEHDEQIIELANFTRQNSDRLQENYENIDDLWREVDDIYDELEDTGDSTYFDLDFDFTGIENTAKYIGRGIKNIFVGGRDRAEESGVSRRQFLAGVAGAAAVDYTNIVPGDESAGDGAFRGGECGWDIDGFGLYGDQEKCETVDNGNGQPPSDGDTGGGTTDPVDGVKTPYDREIELSDEDLQYVIDNTQGTDQELSNIKNIDGNLNDFGYDSNSDEFYAEVEAEDETTRVEISEESYWNVVDTEGN